MKTYFFILLFILLSAPAAFAQTYEGDVETSVVVETPDDIMLSLAHAKNGGPDDFVIKMTTKYGQSGCQTFGPLEYGMRFERTALVISAKDYTVEMSGMPPPSSCSKAVSYPTGNVLLNGADLRRRGIKQIRFSNNGRIDLYDVDVTENYVEISPSLKQLSDNKLRYLPMHLDYLKNPLKLWFYPSDTVILTAGEAEGGFDVEGAVDDLARQRGLVRLRSVMPSFKSPLTDPYSFYYVDKGKSLTGQPGIDKGIRIGAITLPPQAQGMPSPRQMQVYAHKPGIQE